MEIIFDNWRIRPLSWSPQRGFNNSDVDKSSLTALTAGSDRKCEYLWLSSKLGVDKFVNLNDVLLNKQDEADVLRTGFELLST